jgi:hypothetical protein
MLGQLSMAWPKFKPIIDVQMDPGEWPFWFFSIGL